MTSVERCDDGNQNNGDGCSATWVIEPGWSWIDHDLDPITPQQWGMNCGNGVRETGEEWDDGNNFNHDGCSILCSIETGFNCTGGSSTTQDNCAAVGYMPTATLSVKQNNDLVITFNDTMTQTSISKTDLSVQIYGPQLLYSFSFTASFTSNEKLSIEMDIDSDITGNKEEYVIVKFTNPSQFRSMSTGREINSETFLSGYLHNQESTIATTVVGTSMQLLFLIAIALSLISALGGNSMEVMWGLLNTLQIIYFMSYIHLKYPSHLSTFFQYLGYANANNEYLSMLTFLVIPEHKFTQVEINEKFGDQCFFINSSDKIPIIIMAAILLWIILVLDFTKVEATHKFTRMIVRVFKGLKYNFFFRFGLEMYLELLFNGLVSLYFVRI